MRRRHLLRGTATSVAAASVLLLSGCAIPIIGAQSVFEPPRITVTPRATVAPWGAAYDAQAALVTAAMDDMRTVAVDGFILAVGPQPTVLGGRATVMAEQNQSFPRGTYRLIAYCAGTGTVSVSYTFQLGTIHSVGGGAWVACTEGTSVSATDIELPLGANYLRIEADPVDMYGNPTDPRAAIAFSVERAPTQ